jgi:ABC-2 type transport system permease protein
MDRRREIMSDLLLIQNALREALRPRRLLVAVLLILLPAALGLASRLLTPTAEFVPADVYDSLEFLFVFTFTLCILAVIYGTGVVSQEIEQRTIVYLLTRPHPRWRILLSKFLVALLVIGMVTTLSTVFLALAVFGPAHFGEAGIGSDLKALWMGTLTYGSLFLLLGAALPRPLLYALLFVFGWETWVPQLPGQFARVSIMTYLKVLSSREIIPDKQNGFGGNLLLAFAQSPKIEIPVREAWITLSVVAAVALIASLIVFSTREYAPREDSE